MGSLLKSSSHSHSHSHGGGQRGKAYGFMLLLAFGAAILGLMVLHKLRETRVFTLLVKDKDHQLLTLHLLFQREKEFNKEARKKIEEMKSRVYSLRTEKLEIDRKLIEMEATISSLRDERKVIESAFEEKKKEIEMLTKEGTMNSSSKLLPRIIALEDMVKTKESEIEHLKLRLEENPTNSTKNENPTKYGTQNESSIPRESKHAINGEPDKLKEEDFMRANETRTHDESNRAMEGSENPRDREIRGYTSLSLHRGDGQRSEKSDGSENGLGFRGRRKGSKGKRWREIVRNRRLGGLSKQSSYDTTGDRTMQKPDINRDFNSESKLEEVFAKQNHTNEEQNSNENEKRDLILDVERANNTRIEDDGGKQESGGEINIQAKHMKKSENDNEKEKVEEIGKEEVEGEDLEDAETREPEIDRAEIQRLSESESDLDEENEETEF